MHETRGEVVGRLADWAAMCLVSLAAWAALARGAMWISGAR